MGSWLGPQLPFTGTRKVSLRESSSLQPQGTGVLLPCGSRAAGAVHCAREAVCLGLIPALISSHGAARESKPPPAQRCAAPHFLFLAPSRLPG